MTPRPRRLAPETVDRLTLSTDPWLSCDDCFRHVDEYVELVLAGRPERMPAMAVHLRGCPACAEEAETVLALAAEDLGLSPERGLDALRVVVEQPLR